MQTECLNFIKTGTWITTLVVHVLSYRAVEPEHQTGLIKIMIFLKTSKLAPDMLESQSGL